MSTMISKLRRSSRAVAAAVATTALLAGVGAGSAALVDRIATWTGSDVTISDTGWDFVAGPGSTEPLVIPASWGDTGWD